MPAVVRIKRRIDEEPHTAFVLNSKRRRVQNDENAITAASSGAASQTDKDELSTVLKFAGTLENQDDCATKQFAAARLNKATAKDLVQQKSGTSTSTSGVNRREKLRNETQQAAREQRFRVVNCLRTTLDTDISHDGAHSTAQLSESSATPGSSQITIVDIESQQARTSDHSQLNEQQPADSDVGYVYDLYVPENEQQAAYVDMMDDNYLSVCAFGLGEVFYEDSFNDQPEEYDSDDSNQENYYKNFYDEAEDGSEDELCQQVNKFVFDDDEDEYGEANSSEDDDYITFRDPYVHTIDTDADSFVDDVDFFNVERHGSAYERYKRRILCEIEEGKDHCDTTEDEDDDAHYTSAEEQDKSD